MMTAVLTHHRRPAPNYTLRRAVAMTVLAAIALLLAVAVLAAAEALADLGGRPAVASEVPPASVDVRIHVAEAGESLWTIADQHRGDVGRDAYLDALIRLNGGTGIQVGQAVRLP